MVSGLEAHKKVSRAGSSQWRSRYQKFTTEFPVSAYQKLTVRFPLLELRTMVSCIRASQYVFLYEAISYIFRIISCTVPEVRTRFSYIRSSQHGFLDQKLTGFLVSEAHSKVVLEVHSLIPCFRRSRKSFLYQKLRIGICMQKLTYGFLDYKLTIWGPVLEALNGTAVSCI